MISFPAVTVSARAIGEEGSDMFDSGPKSKQDRLVIIQRLLDSLEQVIYDEFGDAGTENYWMSDDSRDKRRFKSLRMGK